MACLFGVMMRHGIIASWRELPCLLTAIGVGFLDFNLLGNFLQRGQQQPASWRALLASWRES